MLVSRSVVLALVFGNTDHGHGHGLAEMAWLTLLATDDQRQGGRPANDDTADCGSGGVGYSCGGPADDVAAHVRQRALLLVVRARHGLGRTRRTARDLVHVHTERPTTERLFPDEGLASSLFQHLFPGHLPPVRVWVYG